MFDWGSPITVSYSTSEQSVQYNMHIIAHLVNKLLSSVDCDFKIQKLTQAYSMADKFQCCLQQKLYPTRGKVPS